MASSLSSQSQPEFRILLDQGFPKPTRFVIAELDQSVVVAHLSDFAPELAERSTPDWFIYCAAAEGGFDGLVVRDRSQLDQLAEMYVLSRLRTLSIVTWRKGIDDPVREWGQLLAYLPEAVMPCPGVGGLERWRDVDRVYSHTGLFYSERRYTLSGCPLSLHHLPLCFAPTLRCAYWPRSSTAAKP